MKNIKDRKKMQVNKISSNFFEKNVTSNKDSVQYTFKDILVLDSDQARDHGIQGRFYPPLEISIPNHSVEKVEPIFDQIGNLLREIQAEKGKILSLELAVDKRLFYLNVQRKDPAQKKLEQKNLKEIASQNKSIKAQIKQDRKFNEDVTNGKIVYKTETLGTSDYTHENLSSKLEPLSSKFNSIKGNVENKELVNKLRHLFAVCEECLEENKRRLDKVSKSIKENITKEPNCKYNLFAEETRIEVKIPATLEKEYIKLVTKGMLETNKEKTNILAQLSEKTKVIQTNILEKTKDKSPLNEALKQRLTEFKKDQRDLNWYNKSWLTKIYGMINGERRQLEEKIAKFSNAITSAQNVLPEVEKLTQRFEALVEKDNDLQEKAPQELKQQTSVFLNLTNENNLEQVASNKDLCDSLKMINNMDIKLEKKGLAMELSNHVDAQKRNTKESFKDCTEIAQDQSKSKNEQNVKYEKNKTKSGKHMNHEASRRIKIKDSGLEKG